MELDAALAVLDEIEFWDGLEGARDEFVQRFEEYQREYGDDDDDESILTLASVEYDTEMIEGTGPAAGEELDLFSYHTLIEHYAAGSYGHFRPTDIVDRFDQATNTHTVGFSLKGASYETSFEGQGDWVDERVHNLINRALEEGGSKRQFLLLPVLDQVVYACLTTPEKLRAATERGVIPRAEDLY